MSDSFITEQLGKMDWDVDRWLIEIVFRAQGYLREEAEGLNADQVEAILRDDEEEIRAQERLDTANKELAQVTARDEQGWASVFAEVVQERTRMNEESAADHEALLRLRTNALEKVNTLLSVAQQRSDPDQEFDPITSPLLLAKKQLEGVIRHDGDGLSWPIPNDLEEFKESRMEGLEDAVPRAKKDLADIAKGRSDRIEAFTSFRAFVDQVGTSSGPEVLV